MNKLSPKDEAALHYVAKEIKIPVTWLRGLINFETGGTWNPKIKARYKGSSSMGLLQFNNAAARDIGYNNSLELVTKNPTIHAQLIGPVLTRLKKLGPYTSKEMFYAANIMPAIRKEHPDTKFIHIYVKRYGQQKGLAKYIEFARGNPGINTIRDYVRKVEERYV